MEEKLIRTLEVPCYLTDRHYRLRPAAFFDLAQDMAVLGANQLSFGEKELSPLGIAWVLARMDVKFIKDIRQYEEIELQTWHRGIHGPFYVRDYQFIGADGKPSAISSSSWILMDINSRRAVRMDQAPSCVHSEPQCTEAMMDSIPGKVVPPRGMSLEKRGEKRVDYSDVDTNQHANNAKYIVWAMDCLPDELTSNHKVSEVSINFNKEARPGEIVELYHIASDLTTHFVEGRIGDRQIFIVRLTFSQDGV